MVFRSLRRVLAASAIALFLALPGAGPAAAHAQLLESDPKDGATLAAPPGQVTLRFSERLGSIGTAVEVTGPAGAVQIAEPVADGARLRIALPDGLPAGAYEVTYRVVSADGHPVSGSVGFTSTGAAPTTAAPGPTAEPTPEPAATTPEPAAVAGDDTDAADDGAGAEVAVAGAGLAAVLLAVVAALLLRRRRGTQA